MVLSDSATLPSLPAAAINLFGVSRAMMPKIAVPAALTIKGEASAAPCTKGMPAFVTKGMSALATSYERALLELSAQLDAHVRSSTPSHLLQATQSTPPAHSSCRATYGPESPTMMATAPATVGQQRGQGGAPHIKGQPKGEPGAAPRAPGGARWNTLVSQDGKVTDMRRRPAVLPPCALPAPVLAHKLPPSVNGMAWVGTGPGTKSSAQKMRWRHLKSSGNP